MLQKHDMPAVRSLYDVLNVSIDAEPVVIEAAYRALMKKYHPDQASGTAVPKDATAINEAFAVLKDQARRAEYDHRLWSKQQAIRLKELQAVPPPPRSRFAGLGGWLVAGLLGCAVAVMATGKSIVPAATLLYQTADSSSSNESAIKAAATRAADAEAKHDFVILPSSAEVIARVDAREGMEPFRARRSPQSAATRSGRPGPSRAPAPRRKAAREDPDFLEREGYIY